MMRASRTFFRFFGYSLLLIILYVFQGSGFIIPEIFGGRPLMLISLALCIASFENTLPSVIFGALCGALTDISLDGSIGYFAFALTIVCYAENFVFSKYFVPSFVTVIVFSFAAVMTVMLIYYLLFVLIAGLDSGCVLFVRHYISRILYTFAVTIPLYFLTAFLNKNL